MTVREEARAIADRLSGLSDNDPLGYDLTDHATPDGCVVLQGKTGLYSGRIGVGIFLAAANRIVGGYRDAVTRVVEPYEAVDTEALFERAELGIDGVGGLVYGFSVLDELLDTDRYGRRAEEITSKVTGEKIAVDEQYDVLHGTAGLIHGLLRLYEQTGSRGVLDRAVECGNHLLENRVSKWNHRVWNTHPSGGASFSSGMAHGAAGIIYALHRLFDHTGRTVFRDAADGPLQFEDIHYAPSQNNWRANWLDIESFPRWWCYGAPGIGLARLGSLEHHRSERVERDIQRACDCDPRLGRRDAICHGTFAHVGFLLELARVRGTNHGQRARDLARRAVERKRNEGGYRIASGRADSLTNASFFLGIAGIGYTLLRSVAPDRLPSVLRFE